jgi:enoyl-CoA hydratase/carnithine racemase
VSHIQSEVVGSIGLITLNRPEALNALSLAMVRDLSALLLSWRDDDQVEAVAIRGSNKASVFGAFCAGGDIRFFHQAALSGDPRLEDFFTEEYALNHLIHHYPKPYVAFMDGIVMGGGMGISQGAALRIVTERTKMAMPETHIGLFPDVGGGYFLSRCPGHVGEYLALTGQVMQGGDAIGVGLADVLAASSDLPALWALLRAQDGRTAAEKISDIRQRTLDATRSAETAVPAWRDASLDDVFGRPSVQAMVDALAQAGPGWAAQTLETLRHRSPLMLHVVLQQLRRGRPMSLADDLRMERDLVRHCFHTRHLQRSGASSETVEGIRALAVDKDHHPRWNPARIEEVTPEMVAPFFTSPWPVEGHPLQHLR